MEKEKKTDASLNEKLIKNRTVMLSGEINQSTADEICKTLLVLDKEAKEKIYLYINSPGGEVSSGLAIYDMIRFISSPVTIIGMGLVASAAAIILLSVDKESRVGLADSTYLIHQPLSQLKGVAIDVTSYAKKIDELRRKLDKIIADATGKTAEKVREDTERDYYLTAAEAVEYGLISKIVNNIDEL